MRMRSRRDYCHNVAIVGAADKAPFWKRGGGGIRKRGLYKVLGEVTYPERTGTGVGFGGIGVRQGPNDGCMGPGCGLGFAAPAQRQRMGCPGWTICPMVAPQTQSHVWWRSQYFSFPGRL